jgi:hypothetical protein
MEFVVDAMQGRFASSCVCALQASISKAGEQEATGLHHAKRRRRQGTKRKTTRWHGVVCTAAATWSVSKHSRVHNLVDCNSRKQHRFCKVTGHCSCALQSFRLPGLCAHMYKQVKVAGKSAGNPVVDIGLQFKPCKRCITGYLDHHMRHETHLSKS